LFESDFLTNAPESVAEYRRLISQAAEILAESLPRQPYAGKRPEELSNLVPDDFLPGDASDPRDIVARMKEIVANSISVTHPRTIAHLHCPPLLSALAGEVAISALNQSMDSFDQAPIATIAEQKFVRWLCEFAGFPATSDGTFTTGGSQSNYMGLLLARDACIQKRWDWSVQKSGLPPESRKLRIFCSEVAHFTVEKSASQLGLGSDSVVRVPVDEKFRMNPAALKASLASTRALGLMPMAIVATAGTTDFGSIDPIPEIAAQAKDSEAWLHVDAAYGGALLFSERHRNKLNGIDLADSISIDFHKLFWQPIPCSAFVVRDSRSFELIRMHADYLNPELHEETGIPDLVTKSILTSRRFDALKLWISFQALGRFKLEAMINRTIELAAHAAVLINKTPQLEIISEPQLSTLVFRYIPSRPEIAVDSLNSRLRQSLFDQGVAVVGHTRVRNRQCLKFTCMNPAVSEEEISQLIAVIAAEGRKLEGEYKA
jgi:L-2,4-diaminobutyrate decarboxylase